MPKIVLSVRIRRELKEEAEKYNINVREVIERALEEEIRKARSRYFRELLNKALNSMNLSIEEWIKSIKEDRRR